MCFVNGVFTSRGGKHLSYLTDHIISQLQPVLERRLKRPVKPSTIRQHLCVFCNCLIENPTFDSQTKEFLTTNSKVVQNSHVNHRISDPCHNFRPLLLQKSNVRGLLI